MNIWGGVWIENPAKNTWVGKHVCETPKTGPSSFSETYGNQGPYEVSNCTPNSPVFGSKDGGSTLQTLGQVAWNVYQENTTCGDPTHTSHVPLHKKMK